MQSKPRRRWQPVTLSAPEEMIFELDRVRHDVSRSKYIQRILEAHLDALAAAREL